MSRHPLAVPAGRSRSMMITGLAFALVPLTAYTAEVACDHAGDRIGADAFCTVEGLDAGTTYDVQLMSYRLVEGTWSWTSSTASNVATGETAEATGDGTDLPRPTGEGIWIGLDELARLPTSGDAWNELLSDASGDPGPANIADMHSDHDVYTLAAALVCARV